MWTNDVHASQSRFIKAKKRARPLAPPDGGTSVQGPVEQSGMRCRKNVIKSADLDYRFGLATKGVGRFRTDPRGSKTIQNSGLRLLNHAGIAATTSTKLSRNHRNSGSLRCRIERPGIIILIQKPKNRQAEGLCQIHPGGIERVIPCSREERTRCKDRCCATGVQIQHNATAGEDDTLDIISEHFTWTASGMTGENTIHVHAIKR